MGFFLKAAPFSLQYAGIDQKDIDVVVMVNELFNHNGIACNLKNAKKAVDKMGKTGVDNDRLQACLLWW